MEGRHAIRKFREAVVLNTAVEDSKRCSIMVEYERLNAVRRKFNETNCF